MVGAGPARPKPAHRNRRHQAFAGVVLASVEMVQDCLHPGAKPDAKGKDSHHAEEVGVREEAA
jgi:hypothetical protein